MNSTKNIITNPVNDNLKLPSRNVSAIAVYSSYDFKKVLLVQRSYLVDEFKGAWSLPSVFNNKKDDNPQTLLKCLDEWFSIKIDEYWSIGQRLGIRKNWKLDLTLYLGITRNEPLIKTTKYLGYKWVDGWNYFQQYDYNKMGDCCKAFFDFLDKNNNYLDFNKGFCK